MQRNILTLILLLLAVSVGWGLTLDEAVTRAMDSNPALMSARQEWEAALVEKTRVTSLPDPMIELGFGSSGMAFEGSMEMAGLVQMIPFPTKITSARSKADMNARAAEARYAARKRQITRDVKHAYVSLLLISETIKIYEENLADVRLLETVTRQRYEVGRVMQHDVIKVELERLLLENNIQILKQDDLVSASVRLKTLLGLDRGERLSDLQKPDIRQASIDPEDVRSPGAGQSPEVAARGYQLETAMRDLSLARMEWIPDLRLKLFREEMDMIMGRQKSRGIMFSLNVPIWAWRNKAAIGKGRLLIQKAEADLEATEDAVEAALEEAVAAFAAARASYDLYETAIVPDAELAYASARSGYETGRMDILSVISAQRGLREANLSRLRMWARLAMDLAEIERITGTAYY